MMHSTCLDLPSTFDELITRPARLATNHRFATERGLLRGKTVPVCELDDPSTYTRP